MTDEIMIDGVTVSEWTDEEVRYNFKKRSTNTIRQIAFDLYKQLKRKEQECKELKKKKEENEKFYLTKYANKDSYCLELEHERNNYKQALDEIEELEGGINEES